jgi:hypothetical protein
VTVRIFNRGETRQNVDGAIDVLIRPAPRRTENRTEYSRYRCSLRKGQREEAENMTVDFPLLSRETH